MFASISAKWLRVVFIVAASSVPCVSQELRMTSFQWQTYGGSAPGPCITSAGNAICPPAVDTTQPPHTVASITPGLCFDVAHCPIDVTDDVTVDIIDSHQQNYVRSHWTVEKDQAGNPIDCAFDLDMRGKQTSQSGSGHSRGRAIATFTALPEHPGDAEPVNRFTTFRVRVSATVQARTILGSGAVATTTLVARGSDGIPIHTQIANSPGLGNVVKTFDASFDVEIGDTFTLEFTGDADSNSGFADFARAELLNGSITASGIFDIDLREAANESALHTDDFRKSFVIRRAAPFDVDLLLGPDFDPVQHELDFEVLHDFDGGTTTIPVPAFASSVPHDQWGVQTLLVGPHQGSGAKQTYVAAVSINVPESAPIGEYRLRARVIPFGVGVPIMSVELEKKLAILVNPWSIFDSAYLPSTGELAEYVLAQSGSVFTRTQAGTASEKAWAFDQFDADEETLAVAMQLLSGATAAERANVDTLIRRFSARVNVQEDNGVLVGNWSGSYAPHTSPSSWTGSHAIVQQYKNTGAPVSYGQCWVFAGVLTSMLRCIGVPTRAVTNYESAHEKPRLDNTVDKVWDHNGVFLGAMSDSIWNFHVWCDAWNHGGWNACDATPQELSGGLHQLGPAPLSAIKSHLGGSFDIDFVTSEVDADLRKSQLDALGVKHVISTDTSAVGLAVLTKVVGASAGHLDVTSDYKSAALKSLTTTLPSGLKITFSPPKSTLIGTDVKWSVLLENTSAGPLTARTTLSVQAISYDGATLGNLGLTADVTQQLNAGAVVGVPLDVPVAAYVPWTGKTRDLQLAAFVEVIGTTDRWAEIGRTTLVASDLAVSLTPSHPVGPGQTVQASASFVNPLGVALNNAQLVFAVSGELDINGSSLATIALGSIPPFGATNAAVTVLVKGGGAGLVSASLSSDELADVTGQAQVMTVGADCNGNSIADALDISSGSSADLNANAVPDECECVFQAYCQSKPNSSGNAATLSTTGSASVTANNLAFGIAGAPGGKPGVLCVGDGQQQQPFVDGYICLVPRAASLVRIAPVTYTDSQGTASVSVDLTVAPLAGMVTANSTWNFQFWFRDPSGAGGSGSNLTDAISVTFCP